MAWNEINAPSVADPTVYLVMNAYRHSQLAPQGQLLGTNETASPFDWTVGPSSPLVNRGCITFVRPANLQQLLSTFAAHPLTTSVRPTHTRGRGANIAIVDVEGGLVVVEFSSDRGSALDTLRSASAFGRAANVIWHGESGVLLSCATGGVVDVDEDLTTIVDSEITGLDYQLDPKVDRRVGGLEAAAAYAGAEFTEQKLRQAPRFRVLIDDLIPAGVPILNTVRSRLRAPVTAAIAAANPSVQRNLAITCAGVAIARTNLGDDEDVRYLTSLQSQQSPSRTSRRAEQLRRDAQQYAERIYARDQSRTGGSPSPNMVEAWNRVWVFEAIAYASQPDPLSAALGSVHAASVVTSIDRQAEFFDAVMNLLAGG